jgi:phosphatidylglycerophosphatase A
MTESPVGTEKATVRPSFLTRLIATGLFSGYSPWASGTVGTAVGVLFYLIPGFEESAILSAMIVVGFLAGVITAAKVASTEGHRLTASATLAKEKFQGGDVHGPDPSIVVIDEIVGMWISLLWMPKTVIAVAVAFILFRVMDVLKPEPARTVEKLPGGWGIMLDDVVAGVYANMAGHAFLFLARQIFPPIS